MGIADDHDPFGFIAQLCHVSSSQECHLSRCRFAGDDEADTASESSQLEHFPLESTPIVIESLPESSKDWNEIDENTPPDVNVDRMVDRGHDESAHVDEAVDLGIDSERCQLRVEKFGGLMRESSRLVKSVGMLKIKEAGLQSNSQNLFEQSKTGKRISGEGENCEISGVKKWKLDSSTEVVELEKHEEIVNLGTACMETCEVVRIPPTVIIDDDDDDDDDECRHVGSSFEHLNNQKESERQPVGIRVLPKSINGQAKSERDKSVVETSERDINKDFVDKCVLSSIASRNHLERKTHEWVRWPDSRDKVEVGKVRNSAFSTVLKALQILSER